MVHSINETKKEEKSETSINPSSISQSLGQCWIVIEDFNEIRSPEEGIGKGRHNHGDWRTI